jgi:two-component system sensor histidine kinase YesM
MPGDMKSTIVPRLILQPIIENICEHSIRSVDDHCLVRISFKSDDDHIGFVIVEDNGKSLEKNMINTLQQKINEDVPVNETSGLINIHKRLQLHFGDECGLSFARSELGGLRVQMTFKIGFINEESSISSTADTNYPSHFMA